MKVVFRTNLGTVDANRLSLDHTKCLAGKSVDVNKDVAEELLKLGIVATPDKAEDDAIVQSAVEEQSRRDAAKEPGIKAVAKEPVVKAPATESDFAKSPRAHEKQ